MCAVWRVQPFFETGAAQYIKPSWLVLDLGSEQALEVLSGYEGVMRTPEELAKQGTYWHYSGGPGAIAKLKDKRLPPLVPEEFAARAESKALTNGKDKQVLLDLQKEVSTTVLRNAQELRFSGLGWGDDDAALLAKALSLCEDVRVLDLSHNRIGPTGASVLAPAAATRSSLTEVCSCAGVPTTLRFSHLAFCCVQVNLKGNKLGEEGWCAVFDALRDNPQNKIAKWDLSGQGINTTIAKSLAAYMTVATSLTKVRALCLSLPSVLLSPLCVCFSSISPTTSWMQKQQKNSRRRSRAAAH